LKFKISLQNNVCHDCQSLWNAAHSPIINEPSLFIQVRFTLLLLHEWRWFHTTNDQYNAK